MPYAGILGRREKKKEEEGREIFHSHVKKTKGGKERKTCDILRSRKKEKSILPLYYSISGDREEKGKKGAGKIKVKKKGKRRMGKSQQSNLPNEEGKRGVEIAELRKRKNRKRK